MQTIEHWEANDIFPGWKKALGPLSKYHKNVGENTHYSFQDDINF